MQVSLVSFLVVHPLHRHSQALLGGRLGGIRGEAPRLPEGALFYDVNPQFTEFIGVSLHGPFLMLSMRAFQSVAVSTGTGETDFERISAILAAVPELQYICVDVANGYSEHFVHFVKDVREKFPSHTIMVSPAPPHPHPCFFASDYFISFIVLPGRKCGDGGDGGGADSGWGRHHQSWDRAR